MNASLTIADLFSLLLFLLGIGALGFLISVLKNVNSVLAKLNKLMNDNSKELDKTLKQLPDISENINVITKKTKNTIEDLQPEINKLVKTAGNISTNVGNITDTIHVTSKKVGHAVEDASDTLSEAALLFNRNISNANLYITIIKEVFEVLKKYILK